MQPDFEHTGSEGDLIDFIHRSTDTADIYFITNRHGRMLKSDCTFRIKNRIPEIWDPVTGKVNKQVSTRSVHDRVEIPLKFEAFQSWFIIFRSSASLLPKSRSNDPELIPVQELSGAWKVAFDTSWGGPESVEFAQLQDWSLHADDRIKFYSGKAVYTKSFAMPELHNGKPLYIDLGVVKNIADISLNGNHLGILWTAPWRIDISSAVKTGENVLKVEVINLWPNRLIGDAALPVEKRLTNTNIPFKTTDKLLPSGLLGPVVIQVEA